MQWQLMTMTLHDQIRLSDSYRQQQEHPNNKELAPNNSNTSGKTLLANTWEHMFCCGLTVIEAQRRL